MSQLNLGLDTEKMNSSTKFIRDNPNLTTAIITALVVVSLISSALVGYYYAKNQQHNEQLNEISQKINDLQADISSIKSQSGDAGGQDALERKINDLAQNRGFG
ncbi:MAG: hypothetical protein H0X72_01610 [Acidobacteria bacterium]|jgi:peptidoglycan hydrolase CwlO-like protein|nr:hypothetical protein [Acidobacteriota bacterium]